MARPIRHLRWYIGGLLFLSTVINYIDRQTLSVLAPYIKTEYSWSNEDFAWIIIAFRVAYSFGQTISGRILDRVGTRTGLTLGVAFYSTAAMLTSLATGFRSLAAFRFLLGAGESANWPGATKAVAEWFPRRESGWAVALFDSGSSIGGALAPFIFIVMLVSGLGMTLLIPVVFISSYPVIVACFAISTFAYAALSTMVLNLLADLYPAGSVATVSGMSGTGAGIGTIVATLIVGRVADRWSFEPILIGASLIPLVATAAVLLLVRNTKATERGILSPI